MNKNGTRYQFVKAVGKKYDLVMQKVNRLIDNINNEKAYVIDLPDMIQLYKKVGVGDVDEFAANYSFGHHMLNQEIDTDESREAMYLECRTILLKLIEENKIPSSKY